MTAKSLETSELKKKYRFRQNLIFMALHLTLLLRVFLGLYTEKEKDECQIVEDSGESGYGCSSDNIVTVRMVTRFEDDLSFCVKKANQDKMNWTCCKAESKAEVQRATGTLGD